MKLGALIKDRPSDIVNLKLDVPTLKGALEKTPSNSCSNTNPPDETDHTYHPRLHRWLDLRARSQMAELAGALD